MGHAVEDVVMAQLHRFHVKVWPEVAFGLQLAKEGIDRITGVGPLLTGSEAKDELPRDKCQLVAGEGSLAQEKSHHPIVIREVHSLVDHAWGLML
jgi:hypothetical protein